MKRLTSLVAAVLALAVTVSTSQAAPWYFDQNDDALGSGVTPSVYNWTTDGSGALPAFWNTNNADGSQASPGLNVSSWVNGNDAIFSAGTDADSQIYGVNIGPGVTAASATVEEGILQVSAGLLDTGAGVLTIGDGAADAEVEGLKIATTSVINTAGTLRLDGGQLIHTNSGGTGGSLISATKNLQVSVNGGTVSYQPTAVGATPNFSTFAIIYGPTTAALLGDTGATTTNGGSGTLIVNNPTNAEFRIQNAGTANSTYAKIVLKGGMFRFGNSGGQFETAAGAVPLSTLADAITLDGGFLGASWAISLDAKRGVVVTANGGGFDNGGGQNNPSSSGSTLTINGPLSGSGELTVKGVTNTAGATLGNRQGGLTLTNVNNNTGFTGGVNLQGSTLTLSESLTATHLRGDHTLTTPAVGAAPTTPCGLLTIASGKTFTFGSDNTDTAFDGQTSGAGAITKVGTGTLSLNSFGGEWGNTGGVNINDGTIKFTTTVAGFSNASTVSIGATGKLNMNGVNDSFGALSGPAGAIVDMKDTAITAGNLTLAAASPVNTTYTGTIVGGGNLTKSSSSTQVLAGNTTLGTVAVNGGILRNNATMTTSGGVTVATAGTLGGTGTISGTVTSLGTLSPGNSVGQLNITGDLTDVGATAAHWAIELNGSTADKVAVTGNINLSGVDFLDITATAPTGTSWIIGSYGGTQTGIFDTITSGYTVSYTGGNITLNAAPACAPGDLNCDTHVDAGDYVFWRKNGGTPGDANYTAWRTNFGVPAGSGSGLSGGTVPEPASLGLLVIGLAAFGLGRRNRVA